VAINREKALAAAQKFLERGQPDRALAEFARVVQDEPGDARTWLKMAEIYARRGQNHQARDIYLRTAELYVEQGALGKAVTVYKNALKLGPGHAQGHLRLGAILQQLGQTEEALQQFGLAAATFQKTGRVAEALPALRQIVALGPDRVIARIQLAESASQAGEVGEAIREFRRAAEFLKSQGRGDEYVRVAERLLFHEPDNFPVARELAAVYIARKNPRLALAKLQPAAKVAPRDPKNIELVALALEQLDPPKARSIWKELAQLHDAAGRAGERDAALRAALALDETDQEARELAQRWGVRAQGVPGSSSIAVPMNVVPVEPERPKRVTPPPPPPAAAVRAKSVAPRTPEPRRVTPPPVRPLPQSEGTPPPPSAALRDGQPTLPPPSPSATPSPIRILSEAEVFVKYGLLERAAAHLRRLLEQEPDHAEARARLADVERQLAPPAPALPTASTDDPLVGVITPPPSESEDDLAAELEQVDFFLEQSLRDEAREALSELVPRFPNHPLLLAKMREVERRELSGLGAVPRDESGPTTNVDSGPGPAMPVAIVAAGAEVDLSTHGDLGIAYKEMGLHEAAIAEFKLVVADPARRVFALTMIGECLEAQGALPEAVVQYKDALNSGPVAEAETTQLYYLLGSAFERMGDTSEALYFFEKVARRGGQFRDVARRIDSLRSDRPAP
jgi:tetratricopeptide (TPR) repeat protein